MSGRPCLTPCAAALMRRAGFILLSFLLLLAEGFHASPTLVGVAAAQDLQVESTSIEHDAEKKTYTYRDARFQAGGLILNAQLIEVHLESNRVIASGQVRFREGTMSGTAERLELDLKEDTATLYEAHLFDSATGYYLSAKKIFRPAPGRFIATECRLTSCSPKTGGWELTAGEIDYRSDEFATGTNTVLWVRSVPVFYFPYVAWPTVDKRRSGFLSPRFSIENSSLERFDLGTRLKVPFFWALNVDHDLTITPEYVSNRGWGLELDYEYAFWADQEGGLRLFGIEEQFARDPNQENDLSGAAAGGPFKPSRHTLDWRHNQGLGERQRLIFTANQSSDGQVRREYFKVEEYRPREEFQGSYALLAPWVSVGLSGIRRSEFEQESVLADSPRFADGKFRPRLLPRLSFNTGVQLFDAIGLAFEVSGQAIRFKTDDVISGQVREIRPAIAFPFSLGGSWELRPAVARRFVRYESLTERLQGPQEAGLNSRGFAQNEFEVELRGSFARVFPATEKGGRALKHRITPRLIFFEVENVEQPLGGTFDLDQLPLAAALPEDELKAGVLRPYFVQRLLTFRLDNTWLTRRGARGRVKRAASLDFIQRYNLLFADKNSAPRGPTPDLTELESEPGEPLMPAILRGSLSGTGLTLASELRFHHQRDKFTTTVLSLSGAVSPRGKMAVTLNQNDFSFRSPDNKLHPEGSRLDFSGEIRATDQVTYGYRGVVNLRDQLAPRDRRLETAELFLDYHPGCCTVRVTYREQLFRSSDDTLFQDRTLLFSFNLTGRPARKTSASAGGAP